MITLPTPPRFADIPPFTREPTYAVNQSLAYLEEYVEKMVAEDRLDLAPDFQRGHVWTESQQVAFMEFFLRGGATGRNLYFNHPGWMGSWKGEFVIVDGLQRLTAALRFLRNEIPVFGHFRREFADKLYWGHSFVVHVNNLKTRAEVLTWYLEFNSGGTPHTPEELARVRALLAQEEARRAQGSVSA